MAVRRKNFFLSFLSVLREGGGGCQGTRGRHTPPAQPAVDLVCLWLITCLPKTQNWSSVARMSSHVEGHCSFGRGAHGEIVQKGTAESASRHGQKKMSMSRECL